MLDEHTLHGFGDGITLAILDLLVGAQGAADLGDEWHDGTGERAGVARRQAVLQDVLKQDTQDADLAGHGAGGSKLLQDGVKRITDELVEVAPQGNGDGVLVAVAVWFVPTSRSRRLFDGWPVGGAVRAGRHGGGAAAFVRAAALQGG
jgi:hypothetical protein